jgi:hypothetical protein
MPDQVLCPCTVTAVDARDVTESEGALLAVLLHRRLDAFRLAWSAALVSRPFTLLPALSGTAVREGSDLPGCSGPDESRG